LNASEGIISGSDLIRQVGKIHEIGTKYVQAKVDLGALESASKTLYSAIFLRIRNEKIKSGEKFNNDILESEVRTSKDFLENVDRMTAANLEYEQNKLLYECAVKKWESLQSSLSMEKVKLQKNV